MFVNLEIDLPSGRGVLLRTVADKLYLYSVKGKTSNRWLYFDDIEGIGAKSVEHVNKRRTRCYALPFGENYNDMLGLDKFKFGYNTLVDAIHQIDDVGKDDLYDLRKQYGRYILDWKGRAEKAVLSKLRLTLTAPMKYVERDGDSQLAILPHTAIAKAKSIWELEIQAEKDWEREMERDVKMNKRRGIGTFGVNQGIGTTGTATSTGTGGGVGTGGVSASTFKSHAGFASLRKPYLHICTSNGMSLHGSSVKISQGGVSTDDNDELCYICQGYEDLLCCDGCARVFHLDCIPLPSIPEGKWYCKLCDKNLQVERFAELNPNAIAAGQIAGVDPMEQITKPGEQKLLEDLVPVVKKKVTEEEANGNDLEISWRVLHGRRSPLDETQPLTSRAVSVFHELPEKDWSSQGEQKLAVDLVHVRKGKLPDEDSNGVDFGIRWKVLHGRKSPLDETQPLVSKADVVFDEQSDFIMHYPNKQDFMYGRNVSETEFGGMYCAVPMFSKEVAEVATNSGFYIPHILYGRTVKEAEIGGMYCAVLRVNSSIVSAGVFRVFSKDVAEIALVATSRACEGKSYFQCLYVCLEKFFKDLGVKNILLSSAEETRSLWTNRFGFNEIPKEKLNELKDCPSSPATATGSE